MTKKRKKARHASAAVKNKKKKKRANKGNLNKGGNNGQFSPSVLGEIEFAPHGVGYVMVEDMTTDIKIPKGDAKDALPGDIVEVVISRIGKSNKRPYGKVLRVAKRAKHQMIARLDISENFTFAIPENPKYNNDIFISKLPKGLKTGDRVLVEITDWPKKSKNPAGKILESFAGANIHDLAMKEILLEKGFPLSFSEKVMEETADMKFEITKEDEKERRDMRDVFTSTIDPFDAKDFDDAISYQVLPDGKIELGVHIADVSHYVKPGTALDKEAYERATSVYLPDRVSPMLPEKISNELCSLRPNEDKFTFSTVFILDKKLEIIDSWIGRTITHSNHRFTYEDVQEIIEGADSEHKETVLAMNKISKHFRKKRFDADAINFSSSEVRFRLDDEGNPIEVVVKTSQESHQLIEEMMLLANRTTAEFIGQQKKNNKNLEYPYRIHDAPDMDRLLPFAQFAGKFGYKFDMTSKHSIAASFNDMIEKSMNIPEHQILHTLGIRTMAKAIYSTNNIGHYGLGFDNYSHFTSPIRRYPDIIAHRVLWNELTNQKQTFTKQNNAEEQCIHCSAQERAATDCERTGNKYKQVQFMQQFIGEEFDAVISGVASFGFWCQTLDHLCEGLISVRDMEEEFIFEEENYMLIGKSSKRKFQMGQKVRIQVAGANLTKRQLDYELIEN